MQQPVEKFDQKSQNISGLDFLKSTCPEQMFVKSQLTHRSGPVFLEMTAKIREINLEMKAKRATDP